MNYRNTGNAVLREETTAQFKFSLSLFINWLFQDMEIHIQNHSVFRISNEGLQLAGCCTKHLGNIHLKKIFFF